MAEAGTCDMIKGNGFTLIELLAAMLVGSIILVSLSYITARLGASLRPTPSSNFGLAEASETLTTLLQGARPKAVSGVQFQLASDRLVAVVSPPDAMGPVGPVRLDLRVERRPDDATLIADMSPLDGGAGVPGRVLSSHALIKHARDISFDQLPPLLPSPNSTLPALIRIHVTDNNGVDYMIAISPRINGDGSCTFDPISQICRP